MQQISTYPQLYELLSKAVIENPPILIRDGGVIASGYDPKLDELRNIQKNAHQFLIDLEQREKERSGINNLKVNYNRVHGYYIEVSRLHSERVPENYQRRQTLKASERYITPELKDFEEKALSANEKALALEKALYNELFDRISPFLGALQESARAISALDVVANFAERAYTLHWCKPELTQGRILYIKQGRHPVVEQYQTAPFVPNDINMHNQRNMLLITGPNMGGKSTYMRQIALITLLAHIGSFVPAEAARFGPVDRIFTRIGASDDLAGGRSTFMVEMTETANILHNATSDSLVLMDEIGRGTSTYDGLSLAYAAAHHLASNSGAFTLFATHYFELTHLPEEFAHIVNVHFNAVEHGDKIIFLHQVQEGSASRSFGIQVAALAGIPQEVIKLARSKLISLEQGNDQENPAEKDKHSQSTDKNLPLFDDEISLQLKDIINHLDPDTLSARQALELIYQLKEISNKEQ